MTGTVTPIGTAGAARVSPDLWSAANSARARIDRRRRMAHLTEFLAGAVTGAAAMFAITAILLCAVAPGALATLIGVPTGTLHQMEPQQPQWEPPK